jgi:hypothetical protein
MRCQTLWTAVVFLSLGWPSPAGEPSKDEGPQKPEAKPTLALATVPEMEAVAELGIGQPCKPDAFPAHTAAARADWAKKCPWVAERLTPKLTRELSRWAKPQMEKYTAVPPLAKRELTLIREDEKAGKLVFEITADTLPVHAPTVTRWLKLYLLYDMGSKAITAVTITIRGQREE